MVEKLEPRAKPAAPAPPRKLTYEEFLNRPEYYGQSVEWVDGKVVEKGVLKRKHQSVGLFLVRLVAQFVETHGLGEVFYEKFQMKLPGGGSGREPDLMFVAKDRLYLIEDLYVNGPSDIVGEIVSPNDNGRDVVDKFGEYERGGVREYWLIDPTRERAVFYSLGPDGLYWEIPVVEGVFHSRVLDGFWLRVEWLWSEAPPLMAVMKEWGMV